MRRRRRIPSHGLLLSADSGIRVYLGHLFSVVNTLLICLVFLVPALGGVQGWFMCLSCNLTSGHRENINFFWKTRFHA